VAPFPPEKRKEQERSMSKLSLIGVAAILSLTVLAGCQRAAAVVDAATTPIYAEPVTGKVR
jgi:hypothetical protein